LTLLRSRASQLIIQTPADLAPAAILSTKDTSNLLLTAMVAA